MTEEEAAIRLIERVKYSDELPGRQYPDRTWGGRDDLVEPLGEILRSFDDPDGRANAAKALGYIGGESALDALCRALTDDASPEVRGAAAWGLRSLGSPASVPALRDVVRTGTDENVRWQAARALAVIEWDEKPAYAERLLRTGSDDIWEAFAQELEGDFVSDRDAVGRRLAALTDADLGPDQLARLLRGLGMFDAFSDRIDAYLDHEAPAVRAAAIDGVRGHDDAPLDRLLSLGREDPDPSVRGRAIDTFGFTVDETGQTPLSKLLQFVDDDAATVREAAVHQLRFADSPDNVPHLVDALEDPAASVRARAAWGLKVASFPGAVPELVAAYPDDDATVRENIVCALQWIAGDSGRVDASTFCLLEARTVPTVDGTGTRPYDPQETLELLSGALRDAEGTISWDAAHALAETEHLDAARALSDFATDDDVPAELRVNGVYFLSSHREYEVCVNAYRSALDDPEPAVRSKAVGIARGMNGDDTTQVLLDALVDESPLVRESAAESARFYDSERVDEALRDRLTTETDDRVVFAIRQALGEWT